MSHKELRLRGISDIDAAIAFLPEFSAGYNRRSDSGRDISTLG